jgi:hypothetical protein
MIKKKNVAWTGVSFMLSFQEMKYTTRTAQVHQHQAAPKVATNASNFQVINMK